MLHTKKQPSYYTSLGGEKRMTHHYKKIAWLLLSTFFYSTQSYRAIVIDPVVDLVGSPMPKEDYATIPVCGGQKEPFIACKRGHQLLFNEIVEVIRQEKDQLCVKVPNIFYITQPNGKKYNYYWAEKKHFLPLENLHDHSKIPSPISPKNPPQDIHIVLIKPYRDNALNITYSAGTRFVPVQLHTKSKKIPVWRYNHKNKKHETISLPKQYCLTIKNTDPDKKINQFVNIMRSWATMKNGYIPYVWGGNSYIHEAHSGTMTEHITQKNGKEISFYTIKNYNNPPLSGFDCSGLILRAAQICNMPYYLKNTTTLAHYLDEINQHTSIKNGDLIWIPRHVMVVSDVKKNLLIEARSYSHGFGKVHEIPLHKVFKNIKTYNDLIAYKTAHKPLERIDKWGNTMDTFKDFKILNIKTIFS